MPAHHQERSEVAHFHNHDALNLTDNSAMHIIAHEYMHAHMGFN